VRQKHKWDEFLVNELPCGLKQLSRSSNTNVLWWQWTNYRFSNGRC